MACTSNGRMGKYSIGGIYNAGVPFVNELKQDGRFSSILFAHPMAENACMTHWKFSA